MNRFSDEPSETDRGDCLEQEVKRALNVRASSRVRQLPTAVYHYTSAESFFSIVRESKFWLTNAAYLNDPSEVSYAISRCQNTIRMLRADSTQEIDGLLKIVEETIRHETRFKAWYLTSFSGKANSLSQWRAYCPKGGYAIGLTYDIFASTLKQRGIIFDSVEYQEENQDRRIKEVVNAYLSVRERTLATQTVDRDDFDERTLEILLAQIIRAAAFFKAPPFEEEDEWRLAWDWPGSDSVLFRRRNETVVPYVEIDVQQDGRLPIHEVFISPMDDDRLAQHSAFLSLRAKGYPHPESLIKLAGYRLR